MMLLFLSFPLFVVGSLIACIIYGRRFGYRDLRARLCLVAFACLVMTYLVGFGLMCYDPHWDDNGSERFMEWRDR